mmetsp:Transcript_5157/g.10798  ORF Transcript_5157/g.10798 Transcript_5157/m.10798 type:complete len:541 (-) Transcript_5157:3496-5118(-)
MMDFEDAAVRLARDQSSMRGRRRGGKIAISAKARKQAEYQKKQQAKLRVERERKKRNEAYRKQYLHECQRSLKEKSLVSVSDSSSSSSSSLLLTPTSIHGNGDKIALPPSVLHTLSSQMANEDDSVAVGGGNPWTFRIGILNPSYEFPASPSMKVLTAPTASDDDEMSDDDDDDIQEQRNELFLDELGHKYLAYTHCTVVEFTQEEGHVGIPRLIAEALLDPKNRHAANAVGSDIPKTLTVDPASSAESEDDTNAMDDTIEQTPGHLAWGAFEIPDVQLEITMVQLPKGVGCTLVPTEDAVKNNFYGLKDVKMVLEQSLIRTRATLSTGDTVNTWHRGTKFDLKVTKVIPPAFRAVTCINTDIEVDIGETETKTESAPANSSKSEKPTNPSDETTKENSGFRLGSSREGAKRVDESSHTTSRTTQETPPVSLLPEPPTEQKEGVCTVQIRYSGGRGKRRFAVGTARVKDLFAFAASLIQQNERSFRLVTRFPRREFSLADCGVQMDSSSENEAQSELREEFTLDQAGIQPGQEMFMIEDL